MEKLIQKNISFLINLKKYIENIEDYKIKDYIRKNKKVLKSCITLKDPNELQEMFKKIK